MYCKEDNCSLEKYYPENLTVLIIDDERKEVEKLNSVLKQDPSVSIINIDSKKDLLEQIGDVKPDVIFIDPSTSKNVGLGILDQLIKEVGHPGIIITSANGMVAENHFNLRVQTIIEKPIDPKEVHRAMRDYLLERSARTINAGLSKLLSVMSPKKLKFSTRKGHVFLSVDEIIYCKADSNYTHLMLADGRKITVSKSLHNFDNKVLSPKYYRISRSAIINTEYLVEINRNEKNCILKQNGEQIFLPVTTKYLKSLLNHYCSCYSLNQ